MQWQILGRGNHQLYLRVLYVCVFHEVHKQSLCTSGMHVMRKIVSCMKNVRRGAVTIYPLRWVNLHSCYSVGCISETYVIGVHVTSICSQGKYTNVYAKECTSEGLCIAGMHIDHTCPLVRCSRAKTWEWQFSRAFTSTQWVYEPWKQEIQFQKSHIYFTRYDLTNLKWLEQRTLMVRIDQYLCVEDEIIKNGKEDKVVSGNKGTNS